MDKLDMPLDDIPKEGRGGGRKGGGRGRGNGRGRGGDKDASSEGGGFDNPLSRDNDLDVAAASWGEEESSGPIRRQRRAPRSNPYARNNKGAEGVWKRGEALNEGARGGPRGARGAARAAPAESAVPIIIKTTSNKVLVTNLDVAVTKDDIEEIFEQAGAIKSVSIRTDKAGNSLGTAELTFAKRGTAQEVVKDFDGAEVDGRPMYLRLLESAGPVVKRMADRAAPKERGLYVARKAAPAPRSRGGMARGGSGKESLFGSKMNETFGAADTSTFGGRRGNFGAARRQGGAKGNGRGRKGGRGGGRGGGGRGAKGGRQEKTPMSAADLDADMDSYFKNKDDGMTDE